MTKHNENVRPAPVEDPDFQRPAYAVDHAANAAKEKAAKAEALRKGGYRDLMGRYVAVEKYFPEDIRRVQRVTTTTKTVEKFDGFVQDGPMRKGENGNIAASQTNDPTRYRDNRPSAPQPAATSQGGDEYIPVTKLAGWTAGATEAVMQAGITLPIRQGMLCIKISDIAKAMWILQTTFGTVR